MIYATHCGNVHILETAKHSWLYIAARDVEALRGLWPDRTFHHNAVQKVHWALMTRQAVWLKLAALQKVGHTGPDPMLSAIREIVADLKKTHPNGIAHPDGAA